MRSGWLAGVDPGWDIRRPKTLFMERREPSTADDTHLTPSQHHGVLPQQEYMKISGSKVVLNLVGADNMKHVEPDDFVIHLRSFQGGIEHSHHRGKVSNAYTVFAPNEVCEPRYYRWVLKSPGFIQELRSTTNQLRDGQSIKFEDFASIGLPFPPLDVQRRIADFLDDQTTRIDKAIQLRQKQNTLAAEGLEAAVDAHFPASGGSHGMELIRARRLLRVLPGWSFPSGGFTDDPSEIRLVRGVNVAVGNLRWDDTAYWPRDRLVGMGAFTLEIGDVVLGMDRPWISQGTRIARVKASDLPCLLLQRVAKLIPRRGMSRDYLFWAYQASSFRAGVESDLTGLSVPHLSGDQISNHLIPAVSESDQDFVAKALDDAALVCDSLVALSEGAVTLLQERKRSLITAAVTGQFDVSSASIRAAGVATSGVQG